MIEKIKLWFLATGLGNFAWLGGLGISLLMGWTFAAGVCGGLFVYLNYAVIKGLIKGIK